MKYDWTGMGNHLKTWTDEDDKKLVNALPNWEKASRITGRKISACKNRWQYIKDKIDVKYPFNRLGKPIVIDKEEMRKVITFVIVKYKSIPNAAKVYNCSPARLYKLANGYGTAFPALIEDYKEWANGRAK